MSLLDAISEAAVTSKPILNDTILVDYRGQPSIFKQGEYDPNMRTLAYRKPTDISKNGDATPVYEIDLFPGLNEISEDAWDILKPSLDELMKPGRRLIIILKEDMEIHNGEEVLHQEKWVKTKALLTECGKFSELDSDRAARLLERCVNKKLLDKFAKAFPKDEAVQEAIAVQRAGLDDAMIKR